MSTQSSDKIVVTDLSLALTISLDHWSRPLPSPHLINFVIHHSVVASGSSDTLPSTINYSTASKTVTALAQSKAWDSLELCAEAVAEVLQSLGAARVCVRIKATKCLAGGQVEVELWRGGAGPEKDSITISDLGVRCIIGVNPQERLEKQLVVIDAKFPLEAPFSTPFPHTKLAEAVHDSILPTSYQTIESATQHLASDLLSLPIAPHPILSSVTVRISKPYALTFAKFASVEITRTPATSSKPALASVAAVTGDKHVAILAVGSNMGDSVQNIASAIEMIEATTKARLVDTSFLYESEPMYVEDQDRFVNGAIKIETSFTPLELLSELKRIETTVGRTKTFRNGPRVVDLDIIFYDSEVLDLESSEGGLIVPHPRLGEREFVLRPLMDFIPSYVHPKLQLPVSSLYASLPPSSPPVLQRILPFSPARLPTTSTQIMSILNLTPDSFSDGGSYADLPAALTRAKHMLTSGGAILDVGGLSTRPGAAPVSAKEEAARVVPLIEALRKEGVTAPISIDTYRSYVAKAAVAAGASCINDVYGGRDSGMLEVMRDFAGPVVLMHSRGDSSTMSSLTDYSAYEGGVVEGVIAELGATIEKALGAGVRRWNIIVDPGIGFAKDAAQNLELLASLNEISKGLGGYPMLVGASRKRFIGALTGREVASERGYGSVAVVAECVGSGVVEIVRVHDTAETKDLVVVLEAIKEKKKQ